MNIKPLKKLISECVSEIRENYELIKVGDVKVTDSAESFMEKFVGKTLKQLLDASSYSNLYSLNRRPIGSYADENDIQDVMNNLLMSAVYFVNFRKLDKLSDAKKKSEYELERNPEYLAYRKELINLGKKTLAAAKEYGRESDEYKAALKAKNDYSFSDIPAMIKYRKDMKDYDFMVNDIHNTKLTLKDVLPDAGDSDKDRERWQSVEKNFDKLKELMQSEKDTMKESSDKIKVQKDIEDLEKLLKNPDPSRVKDYGSIEAYKKMLNAKITALKVKLKSL